MNEKMGKQYKLCSQKLIESIFETKQSVKSYPFIAHYKAFELPANVPFQLVLSVPKRNFKRAHDRNKIKRQMREIIRKNKASIENILLNSNQQFGLFILFTAKEEFEFELFSKKLIQLLEKLTLKLASEI
jgi:ribonuclease P protein component